MRRTCRSDTLLRQRFQDQDLGLRLRGTQRIKIIYVVSYVVSSGLARFCSLPGTAAPGDEKTIVLSPGQESVLVQESCRTSVSDPHGSR